MPYKITPRTDAPGPWYAVWTAIAQAADDLRRSRAEAIREEGDSE